MIDKTPSNLYTHHWLSMRRYHDRLDVVHEGDVMFLSLKLLQLSLVSTLYFCD